MKKNKHEDWYKDNTHYSDFLESQDKGAFEKYVQKILEYLPDKGTFLDVGCGSGIALDMLRTSKISNKCLFGIEVSRSSVNICKKKKLSCKNYDGSKFPFKPESFDMVGSINVLEHTDNPLVFLNEQILVTKKGGYILIVCPNFLSVSNNYHQHTRGFSQKIKNLITLAYKYTIRKPNFTKMKPIQKKVFSPDDDAVNVTNPLDILHWARVNGLKLMYWSSQQTNNSFVNNLDVSILRYILGSSFFVFKKI